MASYDPAKAAMVFEHLARNKTWQVPTLTVFSRGKLRADSPHRSLIAFAAWSSFAHALVMSLLAIPLPTERVGYLVGSAVLVVIGVTLVALAPAKRRVEQVSAALVH